MKEEKFYLKYYVNDNDGAESIRSATTLFDSIVRILERSDSQIILNFESATSPNPTFLNITIGQLYGMFNHDILDERIKVINANNEDLKLLKQIVVIAKKYFKKNDSVETYNKAFIIKREIKKLLNNAPFVIEDDQDCLDDFLYSISALRLSILKEFIEKLSSMFKHHKTVQRINVYIHSSDGGINDFNFDLVFIDESCKGVEENLDDIYELKRSVDADRLLWFINLGVRFIKQEEIFKNALNEIKNVNV